VDEGVLATQESTKGQEKEVIEINKRIDAGDFVYHKKINGKKGATNGRD
jgi:hypothetical protein